MFNSIYFIHITHKMDIAEESETILFCQSHLLIFQSLYIRYYSSWIKFNIEQFLKTEH